jgi:hypothetical protein
MCRLGRFAGSLRPLAASDIGDGQERPPVIRLSVDDAGRHRRIGSGDGLGVVGGPPHRLAGEHVEFVGTVGPERLDLLARELSFQIHDDRAIVQRIGQAPDRGDGDGAVGREGAHLEGLADSAQHS